MAKSKYQDWLTTEGLLQLEAWARDGLTDEQIASNIGISRKTLAEWKVKHSDIGDTLKRGKAVVDIQVENALLKRALGYEYTEQTSELTLDPVTQSYKLMVTKEVKKEVVPDTTAQIFWLKNRKPNEWRDRKEVGVDGGIHVNMTNEQLDAELERLTSLLEGD